MKISLTNSGKRYNREWIFRNFSYEFLPGHSYAITGPNGSGKSTLLQVIAGSVSSSEGKVEYEGIEADHAFRSLSLAAPYLDLIEEMTLEEFLNFHGQFKPFRPGHSIKQMAEAVNLQSALGKQIRYYSSGMKQRAKLCQAIFSDTSCLLLDEPCTNLDAEGIALYQKLVNDYCRERLVIVSSNDDKEYGFCEKMIEIMEYKVAKPLTR